MVWAHVPLSLFYMKSIGVVDYDEAGFRSQR